jgi:hypothetical protein
VSTGRSPVTSTTEQEKKRYLHQSRRTPVYLEVREPDPEQAIGGMQPWTLLSGALQDPNLVAEREVLQLQSGAAFQQ